MHGMKRFLAAFACLILLTGTYAGGAYAASKETMKVTVGKVSLELPLGWYAQSIPNNPSLLLICYPPEVQRDKFRESVSITVGTVENKSDADAYIVELKSSLLSYLDNCQIISSDKSYLVVSGTINNVTVMEYCKFIQKGKTVYCITAAAQPETYSLWESSFKEIIASLKIK